MSNYTLKIGRDIHIFIYNLCMCSKIIVSVPVNNREVGRTKAIDFQECNVLLDLHIFT